MFAIFGAIAAAIGLMAGLLVGELVGGILGIIFAILTAILTLFAGLISWLCPNFTLRPFPIKHPEQAYKDAKEVVSKSPLYDFWHSNGFYDFFFELCALPMVFNSHRYAQKQIKILAEMEYPHCAALLGKIYKDGGGHKHNEKAAEWLQKAIDTNDTSYDVCMSISELCHRDAYLDLAELYLHGKGVPQDYQKCLDLLDKSRYGKTEAANDMRVLANWKLKK